MEKHENRMIIERRIAFSQTDAAGLIHFTTYFTLMEEAEAELFRILGIPLLENKPGFISGFPRVDCQCKFRKPVRFDDLVQVNLGISKIGANRIYYDIRFYAPSGDLCAEGTMITAYVSGQQDGPLMASKLPDQIDEALNFWKNQTS